MFRVIIFILYGGGVVLHYFKSDHLNSNTPVAVVPEFVVASKSG